MSNYILQNDVDALVCSNGIMDVLYEALKNVISSEQKYSQNAPLLDFLEKLDQETYGRGTIYLEITDYFGKEPGKIDIKIFIDLLEKVIVNLKNDPDVPHVVVELFEKFRYNLLHDEQ